MQGIQDLLKNKRFEQPKTATRGVNNSWEMAVEFLEYVGIEANRKNVVQLLSLCKRHGGGKVYGLRSYLKDCNFDRNRFAGFIVYLIKQREEPKTEPKLGG